MISRTGLALLVAISCLGLAQTAVAQTKTFEEMVDLTSGGRLSVEGNKGDIRVTAWDQDRVEITARIEAPRNVDADYARRAVEATVVDVSVTDRSVRVRSNYDDVPYRERSWGGRSRSVPFVHYEIRAPRELELEIETDRGDTEIDGFTGTIDVETDRGTLEASNLSGEIRLSIDRGNRSRMSSIQGSLDIEADRTDISIRDLTIDGNSRLEIDRGDVDLELPASQALSLNAELSRRANLDSDFALTVERQSRHVMRGTINGGGPELMIEADRSTIRLRDGS